MKAPVVTGRHKAVMKIRRVGTCLVVTLPNTLLETAKLLDTDLVLVEAHDPKGDGGVGTLTISLFDR
jgi:hypothetical protein